ncbi:MAG: hypothetical protein LBR60_03695, partial [Fibrobacter sp.]|nr:hypothetical protein [Fibrobacter sp.]
DPDQAAAHIWKILHASANLIDVQNILMLKQVQHDSFRIRATVSHFRIRKTVFAPGHAHFHLMAECCEFVRKFSFVRIFLPVFICFCVY